MLEEKERKIIQDTGTGKDFLNKTWVTKEKRQLLTNKTWQKRIITSEEVAHRMRENLCQLSKKSTM